MKHLHLRRASVVAASIALSAGVALAQSESECGQASKDRFGATNLVKNGSKDAAGVKEPKRKRSVQIELPSPLPQECRSQLAIHEALVSPSGKIEKVWSIKAPCPQVDRAITTALQQWEYSPTLVNKEPVPVCVTISTLIHPR